MISICAGETIIYKISYYFKMEIDMGHFSLRIGGFDDFSMEMEMEKTRRREMKVFNLDLPASNLASGNYPAQCLTFASWRLV